MKPMSIDLYEISLPLGDKAEGIRVLARTIDLGDGALALQVDGLPDEDLIPLLMGVIPEMYRPRPIGDLKSYLLKHPLATIVSLDSGAVRYSNLLVARVVTSIAIQGMNAKDAMSLHLDLSKEIRIWRRRLAEVARKLRTENILMAANIAASFPNGSQGSAGAAIS